MLREHPRSASVTRRRQGLMGTAAGRTTLQYSDKRTCATTCRRRESAAHVRVRRTCISVLSWKTAGNAKVNSRRHDDLSQRSDGNPPNDSTVHRARRTTTYTLALDCMVTRGPRAARSCRGLRMGREALELVGKDRPRRGAPVHAGGSFMVLVCIVRKLLGVCAGQQSFCRRCLLAAPTSISPDLGSARQTPPAG